MKCKFCNRNRGGPKGMCDACKNKRKSLRTHRVFRTSEEADRAQLIASHRPASQFTSLAPTDTYKKANHKMGSETKKLVDFVNKSGTIHYGRYVAQQRGKG